ncbi:ras GEF [Exidia glandulosa HHB12029]|uniref:Ras GEF n=1 Tax=Exidia glandulosa HHB12029 TaxID=1314781 RepID=A0A165CDJ8_EXIGL|nr:ras GEF [Exidia glandulosa HHB12029]
MDAPASFDDDPSSSATRPASFESDASELDMHQAVGLDEYVLALHDFTPAGNATCLAFKAGQVIHVLNRDPSGWWDGELDGKRGWFPSNYTGSALPQISDEQLPTRAKTPGHASNSSVGSWASSQRPAAPARSSAAASQFSIHSALDQVLTDPDAPPILQPLLQGVGLLKSAVLAQRFTHFQPSTACVISCVRTILVRADCLQRDTPTMRLHPQLGVERKRILDDLSALVAQTRASSAEPEPDSDDNQDGDGLDLGLEDNEERAAQHAKMLTHALHVYLDVETFVDVAHKCGIQFPRRRSAASASYSSDSDAETRPRIVRQPSAVRVSDTVRKKQQQRPPTVVSVSDDEFSDTSATPLMHRRTPRGQTGLGIGLGVGGVAAVNARYAGSTPAAPRRSTTSSRTSGSHTHSQKESFSSVSSSSSSASRVSSGSPASSSSPRSPSGRRARSNSQVPAGPCSPSDVLSYLRLCHDDLLSTVAAFIGLAHSHVRTAHSSTKSQLITIMTEAVDKVSNMIRIVDAVIAAGARGARLQDGKDNLYVAVSALVDATKQLTAINSSATQKEEEADRDVALNCATGTLKASHDCAAAVRMGVLRGLGQNAVIVLPPDRNATNESEDSTVVRKAKSLRQLRDEEDTTVQADVTIVPPMRQSEDETAERRDSSSSYVDSMLSSRRDSESLLSDIDETQATEEDEPPSTPSLDANLEEQRRLPQLLIPAPGSTPHHPVELSSASTRSTLEDKILNGDLPRLPLTPLPSFASVSTVGSTSSELLASPPPPTVPPAPGMEDTDARDVMYNAEGMLIGASLAAIVEHMTPHSRIVDPTFATVFFSTFRMFTTPPELVAALRERYNLPCPAGELDPEGWRMKKQTPVRLRVTNLIKTWLEFQWRPSDRAALEALTRMLEEDIVPSLGRTAARVGELVTTRAAGRPLPGELGLMEPESPVTPMLLMGGVPVPNTQAPNLADIPRPIVTKTLYALLREKKYASISPPEFDALELARQLTIMENELYRNVKAEEILGPDSGPGNVRKLSTLSTALTGWVAESILSEPDTKKRTALLKFFIKLADRCVGLNNFSASRAILAALDSSTISRLTQTWQGLNQKSRAHLEELRKLADHARNFSEYRNRLKAARPPAVPFLGLYLTDMTFCRDGNPSHRSPPGDPTRRVINFNKYHKMTRIVQDMQRFQVPYALKSIPEIQAYLSYVLDNAKNNGDLADLYRRSLLVEPRQAADVAQQAEVKQLFGWASSLRGPPTPAPT